MRTLVSAALAFIAALFVADSGARCAEFPSSPVKVIVPYAPGGSGDIIARILGERAGADLGQPIVVENRSGADGVLGLKSAGRARPDGYTIVQIATAHVILPSLRSDLDYDLARDFTPVFGTTAVPLLIAVNSKSGLNSFADLVAKAKATSGGLNYSSGGTGSVSHLVAADLVQRLAIRAQHVPYRGFSGAVNGLLGGQVDFVCATVADVGELARAGSVRLLAVTSDQREPGLPDVPTMAELGFPNATAASWNAYLAPAQTPSAVVDRLYGAFAKAANDPRVRERLAKLGITIKVMNGAELGTFMQAETVKWKRVIDENHIKIEF